MFKKIAFLVTAASSLLATQSFASDCAQEIALLCPQGEIDACLIPNSGADHHFCTPAQVQNRYTFAGRVNISENSTGYLYLVNGTPAIKGFKVAMDHKCRLQKGSVVKSIPDQLIEPTKLVGQSMSGYTAGYEFAVNGGYGALVSAIAVTLAPHGGPFIVDICPVDIYVRY
jgi:hypothetical protein